MDSTLVIRVLLWGLGLCATGFLFLAGWMFWLVGQLHQRVTYKDLKEEFVKDVEKDMGQVVKTLDEIKIGLFGDLRKPGSGLVTFVHDLGMELKELKKNCPKENC